MQTQKKNIFQQYIDSFKGLSKEVWLLALITLINRAGTMVIPFLSIYLKNDLSFSLHQVGWIMTAFGFGSLVGHYIGGKLTDLFGNHKIMFFSLLFTGLGFIFLQYVYDFEWFLVAMFVLICIADTFRPAMFVALSAYSKPENKTRSVTLIRLAINLGFSAGPAVGGFLILTSGYTALFWLDGVTCISAAIMIITLLHPKRTKVIEETTVENPLPVRKDTLFWWFFAAMFLYACVFVQLFTTLPLYYRNGLHLDEGKIGLLMTLNGLIIFFLEMPVIKWLQNAKYSTYSLMIFGTIVTTLGFVALNLGGWIGIAILSMILVTVGEMVGLPFGNTFALSRAKLGRQGEYMAWYSIAFSLSHIFSHNVSMSIAENYGFEVTWYFVGGLGILCTILLIYTKKRWNL